MKMNKKIVVSSLAICMGAGLVGSVSGTVAWYQYSTKAAVNMMGASAGVSQMLQIGIGGDGHETFTDDPNASTATVFKSGLSLDDIAGYLNGKQNNLKPISAGNMEKDDALPTDAEGKLSFIGNPIAYEADPEKWIAAEETDYVVLPLWIRAYNDTASGRKYVERKFGLSDVTIENKNGQSHKDITDAVRVHVSCGNNNALCANVDSTVVHGNLDVNGDGNLDRPLKYEWQTAEPLIDYGNPTGAATVDPQTSYKITADGEAAGGDLLINDVYDKEDNEYAYEEGLTFGKTLKDGKGVLVNVTIFLEGWQKLQVGTTSNYDAMWNGIDYIGSNFYVGLTFSASMEYAE